MSDTRHDTHTELYGLLHEFVGKLFSQLDLAALERFIDDDLTLTQAYLLMSLAKRQETLGARHRRGGDETMTIGELAEAGDLSITTASRNVDRLVRLYLINRTESADDRRVKLVTLSPLGISLVQDHLQKNQQALQTFTESLPIDDCSRLIDALRPLLAHAPQEAKDSHI